MDSRLRATARATARLLLYNALITTTSIGVFVAYPWTGFAGAFVGVGMFIGVFQILWVLPIWLWLRRRGHVDSAAGVVIGASITLLLTGLCASAGIATS